MPLTCCALGQDLANGIGALAVPPIRSSLVPGRVLAHLFDKWSPNESVPDSEGGVSAATETAP